MPLNQSYLTHKHELITLLLYPLFDPLGFDLTQCPFLHQFFGSWGDFTGFNLANNFNGKLFLRLRLPW